jgi:hypothetical protein
VRRSRNDATGELKKMMKATEKPSGHGLSLWLQDIIKNFCLESPDNSLENETDERAWDAGQLHEISRLSAPLGGIRYPNQHLGVCF